MALHIDSYGNEEVRFEKEYLQTLRMLKRKFSACDSAPMIRASQPLLLALEPLKQRAKRWSKNTIRFDNLFIKGPIDDLSVVQRCLFRQHVLCEVWNDTATVSPISLPWSVSSAHAHHREFHEVRLFVAQNAMTFSKWITQTRAHCLLLDERLMSLALDAFTHISSRYVLGIKDKYGAATLSHVLVNAPGRCIFGISISDDGEREHYNLDHQDDQHCVASLLSTEKWCKEARNALRIVCGGATGRKLILRLQTMNERDNWFAIYRAVDAHRLKVDVLEMQKRLFALMEALKRGAILQSLC